MVFVQDEGSRFDAPLDVLWEYLLEGSAHDRVHASTRSAQFEPISHSSFTYRCERRVEGVWLPETIRITLFRPLGVANEMIEGPFAGTKMVYLYKPRGEQTQIDVYADLRSDTLEPERLERAARAMWETEFNEDAPAIRRFAASRPGTGGAHE